MTSTSFKYPVFSIITPTFRRPEMLVRNIKSVLNQTFRNFEHIIVDDGNDPATDKIVESFNDERLILVKHGQPGGAAAAYNSGIKESRGEFITFLDDDDEYMAEYLEKIHMQFNSVPSDVGFIWTGIERVVDYENGNEKVNRRFIWSSSFSDTEKGLTAATSIGNGFGVCLRRSCIEEIGLYDERLPVAEDTDFLIRLASKFKFQTIPEVLVRIHSHEKNQLTRKHNFPARIEGKELILQRHEVFLNSYPGVFAAHYLGYAYLCYESGLKNKGRKAMRSIIRKNPFRFMPYVDFFALETTGSTVGNTQMVLLLRGFFYKIRQS